MKEKNLLELEEIYMTSLREARSETSEEKREAKLKEALRIGEMFNKNEETYYQYTAAEYRIEKDAEKSKDMIELEKEKIKVPWQKTAIDVAKIAIPCVIPLIVWRRSFKDMLRFEESGRFTSNASRVLHMPKIF